MSRYRNKETGEITTQVVWRGNFADYMYENGDKVTDMHRSMFDRNFEEIEEPVHNILEVGKMYEWPNGGRAKVVKINMNNSVDIEEVNGSIIKDVGIPTYAQLEEVETEQFKLEPYPTDEDLEQLAAIGESKKFDTDKLRYDLIPAECLNSLADIFTFGASKYAPNNWQKLSDFENRYYSALMRHLEAWRSGENNDPESGRPHLAHAFWNCCALLYNHIRYTPKDVT